MAIRLFVVCGVCLLLLHFPLDSSALKCYNFASAGGSTSKMEQDGCTSCTKLSSGGSSSGACSQFPGPCKPDGTTCCTDLCNAARRVSTEASLTLTVAAAGVALAAGFVFGTGRR